MKKIHNLILVKYVTWNKVFVEKNHPSSLEPVVCHGQDQWI